MKQLPSYVWNCTFIIYPIVSTSPSASWSDHFTKSKQDWHIFILSQKVVHDSTITNDLIIIITTKVFNNNGDYSFNWSTCSNLLAWSYYYYYTLTTLSSMWSSWQCHFFLLFYAMHHAPKLKLSSSSPHNISYSNPIHWKIVWFYPIFIHSTVSAAVAAYKCKALRAKTNIHLPLSSSQSLTHTPL